MLKAEVDDANVKVVFLNNSEAGLFVDSMMLIRAVYCALAEKAEATSEIFKEVLTKEVLTGTLFDTKTRFEERSDFYGEDEE